MHTTTTLASYPQFLTLPKTRPFPIHSPLPPLTDLLNFSTTNLFTPKPSTDTLNFSPETLPAPCQRSTVSTTFLTRAPCPRGFLLLYSIALTQHLRNSTKKPYRCSQRTAEFHAGKSRRNLAAARVGAAKSEFLVCIDVEDLQW